MEKKVVANGLLSYSEYFSVYDKELESSISFAGNKKETKKAIAESPDYFTNEVLISIHHFLKTGTLEEPQAVLGKLGDSMTSENNSWTSLSIKKQIEIMGELARITLTKE